MKHFFLLIMLITGPLMAQQVKLLNTALDEFHNVRDFCLSQDGNEAYFTVQSPMQEISQIVYVKNENWNKPELLSFCDEYSYLEPFLSQDGKRLYFSSNRPKNNSSEGNSDYDIWYVERKDKKSDWSKPIHLGSLVNSSNDEFYPSLSENGNLYFTMDAESGLGKDDIYYCKWNGKEYSEPILLNNNINSEGYEFNAFISNDESFLIYTKYRANDGFGSGDLYIAKKNQKGEWMPSVNMGRNINSKYMDYCPFYDSNTGMLYFTSKRSNLAPKKFTDFKELQEYISSGENGLSKIYKCKVEF